MKGEPTGFWAKLNQGEDGNILEWHPLMAHSADVAAVTETLLNKTILNQRVAALIGWEKLSEAQIARLSALAAIHDAGKVNHGFQNKMHKSKQPQAGHVTPIIELLGADDKYVDKFLLPLKIDIILQWFSDPHKAVQFLFATWGHHGRPVPIQHHFKATLWEENAVRNPQNGLKELGEALQQWFPKAFDEEIEPFPSDPVFQHTFNGLLTLAD
jgi:CRISPR-associated endonuclease/helicase Cas3